MQDLSTDLGIVINRIGIKSKIKTTLRQPPEYHMSSLVDLENGFCSDCEKTEITGIHRILESFGSHMGSSGHVFSFFPSHFNFYTASEQSMLDLNYMERAVSDRKALSS
jgi:hypothetical protein